MSDNPPPRIAIPSFREVQQAQKQPNASFARPPSGTAGAGPSR